jgi:septum formation protein
MPAKKNRAGIEGGLSPLFGLCARAVDVTVGSASPFWRESAPLILASKSAGRRQALAHSGVPFEAIAADVDERAIESRLEGADADAIASTLARAKALAISAKGRLVLGADQVASCEGRIFGKPADMIEAEALLRFLSGRRHRLHSAIALVRDGAVLFETVAHADLTMRRLSDAFVSAYLTTVGDNALTSAGAYQIEGLGAQLFSKIEGDHWTIMGLPLLELLEALRREGALLS